jgi:DNA (cytosine-5)-methyltransferase 1
MRPNSPIPVVDLFAGPGGLGEGFSALDDGSAFRILVSAEMDKAAHQTLRLRAFYRLLKRQGPEALRAYYRFCNGITSTPWDDATASAWVEAGAEARCLTLGTPEGNAELEKVLSRSGIGPASPWVLIGGPPCQACSLVGRARNRGKLDYRPEDDHRHFLYREYLNIIQRYRPAVFVMENVKGILSSRVGGQRIFHTILRDLADPDKAVGASAGVGYKIHSLSAPVAFGRNMDPEKDVDAHQFVIKAENYGIPQARHRVILLGIRADIDISPDLLEKSASTSTRSALKGLPPLRSRISKKPDSGKLWASEVREHLRELIAEATAHPELMALLRELRTVASSISEDLSHGSLRLPRRAVEFDPYSPLEKWYHDPELAVWLNEEARGHMSSDLRRYVYAAAFSNAFEHSPKGHQEFLLSGLHPNHRNWRTGKFADRFRVQLFDSPSTTITSHIAKDGHYFIHPDPKQCRSLTVREAARLQTFPDNYFFQGNRTEQFHQVGNAVPPFLATKIANIVRSVI